MITLIIQMKVVAPSHTTKYKKRIQMQSWLQNPWLFVRPLICKFLTLYNISLWNKQSNLLLESVFQGLIRSFNIKKREFKISSPILHSLLYSQNRYIYILNSVGNWMTIISIKSMCWGTWPEHSRALYVYGTDMMQSTEHWLLVRRCETYIQALQLSYVSLVTLYTSLLPGKFSHRIILMNKWVMWVKSTSSTLEREVLN